MINAKWMAGKNFSKMNTSNYPAVVQAIHNEFNLAGEKLLQESLAIIEAAEKIDNEKATRLKSVGFSNNPLVKKAEKVKTSILSPIETAEIVLKYKRQFPLNKFITSKDAQFICNKYKLILGNSEQYKGFVPEKNLLEIENFKNNNRLKKRFRVTKLRVRALFDGALNTFFNAKCRAAQSFLRDNNYTFICDNEDDIKIQIIRAKDKIKSDAWFRLENLETIELSIFDICAPKKDMISNSLFEKMIPSFEMEIIPDPVVLYPVEHGYIIVTAWGDEASDPLVVNELNN